MQEDSECFYIGIDGGGSKTKFCLIDNHQNILYNYTGPSTNKNSVGEVAVKNALFEGFTEISKYSKFTISNLKAICIGMAGIDRPKAKALVRSWVEEFFISSTPEIYLHSDAVIGIASGTGGTLNGIVLISGTGMIALGIKSDNKTVRCGGWGSLFGDIGCGYWIGTEILRVVANSRDGIGEDTILDNLLQEYIGGSDVDLLTWAYQSNTGGTTWKKFADLAPLACKGYIQNDKVSISIINNSVNGLFTVTERVLTLMDSQDKYITLVLVGGVVTHENSIIEKLLKEKINKNYPKVNVTKPIMEVEKAAAILAKNTFENK